MLRVVDGVSLFAAAKWCLPAGAVPVSPTAIVRKVAGTTGGDNLHLLRRWCRGGADDTTLVVGSRIVYRLFSGLNPDAHERNTLGWRI